MKIKEILSKYPGAVLFLRGDSNVNPNNKPRSRIFSNFCDELKLKNVPIHHKTYHHFLGQGAFDSSIDVILHSLSAPSPEKSSQTFCQNIYPEVDSHHDPIASAVSLPCLPIPDKHKHLVSAPRVPHIRHKICWNEDDIPDYKAQVGTHLARLRSAWIIPNTSLTISTLIDVTNKILSEAAKNTNHFISLQSTPKPKYLKPSKELQEAKIKLKAAHNAFKKARNSRAININHRETEFKQARHAYRLMCRTELHKDDLKRDSDLFSVFSSSAPPIFKSIRSLKTSAISNFMEWSKDCKYILAISEQQVDIPPISLEQSTTILHKMKPHVIDSGLLHLLTS